ncbi:hypothetical protein GOODEAATRI_000399 [Goodea atripinnis]|uniref:Secreted protein n=1 Tax=Goodea atripinnis TaxID=208336 RepID=A0ABV0PU73_9TELE
MALCLLPMIILEKRAPNGPPAKSYQTIWPSAVVAFEPLFLSASHCLISKGCGGAKGIICTPEHILPFKTDPYTHTHTDTPPYKQEQNHITGVITVIPIS